MCSDKRLNSIVCYNYRQILSLGVKIIQEYSSSQKLDISTNSKVYFPASEIFSIFNVLFGLSQAF